MDMAVLTRITQNTPASAGVVYGESPIMNRNLDNERNVNNLERHTGLQRRYNKLPSKETDGLKSSPTSSFRKSSISIHLHIGIIKTNNSKFFAVSYFS